MLLLFVKVTHDKTAKNINFEQFVKVSFSFD